MWNPYFGPPKNQENHIPNASKRNVWASAVHIAAPPDWVKLRTLEEISKWRKSKTWHLDEIQWALRNSARLRRGIFNGNFRILKWRYCTIFLAIFCGDIPWKLGFKNRPNIYGIGPMNRFTGELSRKVGSIGILPDCHWDNYHLDGLFVGLSS